MEHDYIDVDVDSIPYEQLIDIDNNEYYFLFQYNEISRQFLLDIRDINHSPIELGEPLILNQPLWRDINNSNLPPKKIVPMDESGQATRIDYGNLGSNVKLCLVDDDNG